MEGSFTISNDFIEIMRTFIFNELNDFYINFGITIISKMIFLNVYNFSAYHDISQRFGIVSFISSFALPPFDKSFRMSCSSV